MKEEHVHAKKSAKPKGAAAGASDNGNAATLGKRPRAAAAAAAALLAPPPLYADDAAKAAEAAAGPRVIHVEGGRGAAADRMDGKTQVTLPVGAGLADLKKLVRKTFGKYAHHAMVGNTDSICVCTLLACRAHSSHRSARWLRESRVSRVVPELNKIKMK